MKSLHCNLLNTYTLYFNILFYVSIICGDKRFLKGLSYHIIPFFITSQYMCWYDKVARGCGCRLSWSIFCDIIAHWLPLIIYIMMYKQINEYKMSILGYVSPIILFFVYLCYTRFNMRIYNGNHLSKYIAIYVVLLIITTVLLK